VLTTQEQVVEVFLDTNGNGQLDLSEPIGPGVKDASGNYSLKFDSTDAKHQNADKNKNNTFDTKPAANDPGLGKYVREENISYFDFNLNNQLDYYEPSTRVQSPTNFVLNKNSPPDNTDLTYYYFDSDNDGTIDKDDYWLIQEDGIGEQSTWYFDINGDGEGQKYEKLDQTIVKQSRYFDALARTNSVQGTIELKDYTTELEGTFVTEDDGDRLTAKEIVKLSKDPNIAFKDLINYNLAGEANLGLEMKASVGGDAAFPSISTNLAVNYPIFNYGNQEEADQQKFTLAFNDLTLDIGSFITDFAKPVFDSLNDLFKPLRPVIDVLNKDTGFLIKIFPEYDTQDQVKGYTGNKDGKLSLIEFFAGAAHDPALEGLLKPLLDQAKLSYPNFQQSIDTATKVINLFTEIDRVTQTMAAFEEGQNITIDLGSYPLNNIKGGSTEAENSTTETSNLDNNPNLTANPPTATQIQEQVASKDSKAGNLLSSLKNIDGLELEFLNNPITILRILLGEKNVNLLTFDVPDLNLLVPFTTGEKVLGYVVPPGLEITGKFDASFKAKTDLFVGFDTGGLELWRESDFSSADSYKIFDGFYLRDGIDDNKDGILQPDEDTNEFTLNAAAQLNLSANAYIAKLTGYGGLEGTAGLDVVDGGERNGTNDGKVRFSEVGEKLAKVFSGELGSNVGRILTEFIDLSGKLEAFFGIEVKVGLSILGAEIMKTVYKDELGRFPIFEFDLADLFPDTVNQGSQASITKTGDSGNNELIGSIGDDTLDGKDGDDTLRGDIGNDHLSGGYGNDTLEGGTGNDTLEGNIGDDTLKGDLGNDVLTGAEGNDQIDGGADIDKIEGFSGNDTLDGGDGADDIRGGFDNDDLIGNFGNDVLVGDDGDDVLTGGAGDDVLSGSAGKDIFKFLSLQNNGYDKITDFNLQEDRISISVQGFGGNANQLQLDNNGILSYNGSNIALIENKALLTQGSSINNYIDFV